jgi:predicted regulator of Ras-like GTPase activity (Roadblock/LC7/MglB family)
MDEQLLALLEYRDVFGALVTTNDGLPVAAAGIQGEDTEVIAAAGTTLLRGLGREGERSLAVEIDGGQVHLLRGEDITLVVLTEPGVPHEALVEPMGEVLGRFAASML